MNPPWVEYPDIAPRSLGWRMGEAQAYLENFWRYYNSLGATEQNEYKKNNRPPLKWSGFYGKGALKYVVANAGLLIVMFALSILLIASIFNPTWWIYILVVPLLFFTLGIVEQRLCSSLINRVVDYIYRH